MLSFLRFAYLLMIAFVCKMLLVAYIYTLMCMHQSFFAWFVLGFFLCNVIYYVLQGICQLFEIFFYFVFETFCEPNTPTSAKGVDGSIPRKFFSFP